jgi:hypothetical protein
MSDYHGIIVKESLKEQFVLNEMKILGQRKSVKWTLFRVGVDENKIDEVVESVQKSLVASPTRTCYYAHFYRGEKLIVVFPKKIFRLTPEKETWRSAIEYGKSVGIPGEELDFKPCRFEEETF